MNLNFVNDAILLHANSVFMASVVYAARMGY